MRWDLLETLWAKTEWGEGHWVGSIDDGGLNTGQLWALKFKDADSSRNALFPFFSSTFTDSLLGARHCTSNLGHNNGTMWSLSPGSTYSNGEEKLKINNFTTWC